MSTTTTYAPRQVGDTITITGWNDDGNYEVRTTVVTADHLRTLALLRAALLPVRHFGKTVTYKTLEEWVGGPGVFNHRKPGEHLDVLSDDCFLRGERSLAELVVRWDGYPGYSFLRDTPPVRP